MTDDLDLLERDLGDQLRCTFQAAAAGAPLSSAPARRQRNWRRIGGIGLIGGFAIATGAAWLHYGEGTIRRVPVEHAILEGESSGGQWYLLPTGIDTPYWGMEECKWPGVMFFPEVVNKPGLGWNGGGVDYGTTNNKDSGCMMDQTSWLDDPTQFNLGYTRAGFEREDTPFGASGAFHPSIMSVRVETDTTEPFEVDTIARDDAPDGPRYVAFTFPADTKHISVTILDASGEAVGTPRETDLS